MSISSIITAPIDVSVSLLNNQNGLASTVKQPRSSGHRVIDGLFHMQLVSELYQVEGLSLIL